jgi:hypothetical protein
MAPAMDVKAERGGITAGEAPVIAEKIEVSQTGADVSLWGMLLLSMLCGVPGMWLAVLQDGDATGWAALLPTVGILFGIVLAIIGMFAGLILWFALEQRWLAFRGIKLFSAVAPVRIDGAGIWVEGLGLSSWLDVLDYEGIPDSDSAMIVRTRGFGGLMIKMPCDVLLPVLDHYLLQAREQEQTKVREGMAENFQFKALVFHWPRFMAWMVAGYALSAALGIAVLVAKPDAGFLKGMVVLCVLVPMIAWLIWAIPLGQLSTFSSRRVRAFALEGAMLSSTDGRWQIDLKTADVRYRSASGIGYEFEFVSIRPAHGPRLDLLPAAPEMHLLLSQLNGLGVLADGLDARFN